MANLVARTQMANAFAEQSKIGKVFFYFLLNDKSKLKKIKRDFHKKVILKPIYLPFYKTQGRNLSSILQEIMQKFIFIAFIAKIIRSNIQKKDYIFVRGWGGLCANSFLNLFSKHKFAFEIHNYEFGKSKMSDLFYRYFMNSSKFIVTISEFTKQGWIKSGIDSNKILVLPSGVNTSLYGTESKLNKLRIDLELPVNKKILCYIGNMYMNRGIEEILYAANKMDHSKDFIYLMVGGKPEDIQIYKDYMLSEYGHILSNVLFTGHMTHSRAAKYAIASDILLAPYSKNVATVHHMSPIKLYEYLATKKPIIVSDLERIRDVVGETNVTFFESDNGMDFFRAVNDVITNYNTKKKLASDSTFIAENASWYNRAKKILNMY